MRPRPAARVRVQERRVRGGLRERRGPQEERLPQRPILAGRILLLHEPRKRGLPEDRVLAKGPGDSAVGLDRDGGQQQHRGGERSAAGAAEQIDRDDARHPEQAGFGQREGQACRARAPTTAGLPPIARTASSPPPRAPPRRRAPRARAARRRPASSAADGARSPGRRPGRTPPGSRARAPRPRPASRVAQRQRRGMPAAQPIGTRPGGTERASDTSSRARPNRAPRSRSFQDAPIAITANAPQ